jgi:hypothetical protein
LTNATLALEGGVVVEKLKNHMEALRQELNQLMEEFDTCDKEKLLKVSRELDEVICKYIRMEKSIENIKDTH